LVLVLAAGTGLELSDRCAPPPHLGMSRSVVPTRGIPGSGSIPYTAAVRQHVQDEEGRPGLRCLTAASVRRRYGSTAVSWEFRTRARESIASVVRLVGAPRRSAASLWEEAGQCQSGSLSHNCARAAWGRSGISPGRHSGASLGLHRLGWGQSGVCLSVSLVGGGAVGPGWVLSGARLGLSP
jgi:hypothetical protein